ncbi:NmrA family NAD(P)-binding protein [Pseudonocardia acaciae]|uniref:NmrA family NAD(P)-binding protein n=1 Tax=Pseudonocardia acaciae TaxID=551276 RepID=UPI0007E8DFAB|nr:NmrA family NAD(P)-binding protein [Pseudonocardia acaciae]
MKLNETILVTGAAGGRQGSTGYHVTRLLRERGHAVRALVHTLDERSDRLRALGAEVVKGDLLDPVSVAEAMDGVRRSYFTFPVQDGLMGATATFASAAREAGSELVVNLSQLIRRTGEHRTPHQRRHWLSEQVFDWAGVGAVHLDATVFYENLRALTRTSVASAGEIRLPWGPETTTVAMIGAVDVARVAAGLLTGPAQPNGTVLPLIGTVVTVGEIAEAYRDALGRPVRYREITDEQWVSAVSAGGMNPTAAEHLSHLWRRLRETPTEERAEFRVSESIERITGAPPTSLREFLAEQRDVFTPAS